MRLIKYLRLVKGMTQLELATQVDIAQPQISYLEMGQMKISRLKLEEIAHALDHKGSPEKLLENTKLIS